VSIHGPQSVAVFPGRGRKSGAVRGIRPEPSLEQVNFSTCAKMRRQRGRSPRRPAKIFPLGLERRRVPAAPARPGPCTAVSSALTRAGRRRTGRVAGRRDLAGRAAVTTPNSMMPDVRFALEVEENGSAALPRVFTTERHGTHRKERVNQ